MTRLAHDPRTKAYVARRTAEGKTKKEIIRCLKRYIAREIYKALAAPAARTEHHRSHTRSFDSWSALCQVAAAVEGWVEGGAVLPAAPDDAQPGAGQDPDGVRVPQPRPVAAA